MHELKIKAPKGSKKLHEMRGGTFAPDAARAYVLLRWEEGLGYYPWSLHALDLATGALGPGWNEPRVELCSLAFAYRDRVLVSDIEGSYLWTSGGELVKKSPLKLLEAALSPDGRLIAGVSGEAAVVADAESLDVVAQRAGDASRVDWTPDGRVALGGADLHVRVFDQALEKETMAYAVPAGKRDWLSVLRVTPSGDLLAAAGKSLYRHSPAGQLVTTYAHGDVIRCVSWRGSQLFTGCADKLVRSFDPPAEHAGHSKPPFALSVQPDCLWSMQDKAVRRWDL